MAERFYAPDLASAAGQIVLEGPEAHHIRTVLRAKPGTAVEVFDGQGTTAAGQVAAVERHAVVVDLGPLARVPAPSPAERFTIAAALPKGDRASWMIEKLTELGVDCFQPLRTARSVTHPREGKEDKLRRTMVEACKQCGRAWFLDLEPLAEVAAVLAAPAPGWLLDPRGEPNTSALPFPAQVLIGPEGGWTGEELNLARAAGWRVVRIAGPILRVETAAITLAAWRLAQHSAAGAET